MVQSNYSNYRFLARPTFVHAIKQLIEGFGLAVVLMLLPSLSVITPKNDQLTFLPSHGAKVRDLHYHRAARTDHIPLKS